jgi:hypothetical protein
MKNQSSRENGEGEELGVLGKIRLSSERADRLRYVPHAPSNNLYPSLMALYTTSAQVFLSTFHSPSPTCGILAPLLSLIVGTCMFAMLAFLEEYDGEEAVLARKDGTAVPRK